MALAEAQSSLTVERHVYEDPFLDMASTRLPKSMRKLQELCQIFAMTHPQIAPIVWRLAEYPITSVVYTGDNEARRQMKEVMEDEVGILDRCVEWGLDFHSGGNCFVTVQFPFLRYYQCRACKGQQSAREAKNRRFDGREFEAHCPKCRGTTRQDPVDQYVKRAKGINVVRLEPMLITIKYNPITGKSFYFYDIPAATRRAIQTSDWDIIDSTPVSFIQCVLKNTKLRLSRVFHFKRPTLSGRDMQWGMPLILPALKSAYLNQIMCKADEMISSEHAVPLRIMFPEAGTQDPLARIALGSFKGFMDQSIKYWRRDKNAIITAPLPVGVKVIGGDAGAYSSITTRQFIVDEIIGAMMVTKGFVMGGEQWSAASIQQRTLENSFLNYLRRMDKCLQWVGDEIRSYLGLPVCAVAMKPFKKLDDVQLSQLMIQLAREKRVSWNETLSRFDLDSKEQLEQIEREAGGYLEVMIQEIIGQAEAGAKSATINAVAQNEAEGVQAMLQKQLQSATQPPARQLGTGAGDKKPAAGAKDADSGGDDYPAPDDGQPAGEGQQKIVMDKQIESWAHELLGMPEDRMKATLARMAKESPELGRAVAERASQMQKQQAGGGGGSQDAELAKAKTPEDMASRLMMMSPQDRLRAMRDIQQKNPALGLSVMRLVAHQNMANAGMAPAKGPATTVDMRPQPEQLPPRRGA